MKSEDITHFSVPNLLKIFRTYSCKYLTIEAMKILTCSTAQLQMQGSTLLLARVMKHLLQLTKAHSFPSDIVLPVGLVQVFRIRGIKIISGN